MFCFDTMDVCTNNMVYRHGTPIHFEKDLAISGKLLKKTISPWNRDALLTNRNDSSLKLVKILV